jgi:hypothetical protein
MTTNEGISVADALALRGYGNDNNDMWGGNGSWWIVLLILLFAGGWNNGFGFGGNSGYSACCTPATSQGMSDAFNFNQLDNGLRNIQSSMNDNFCNTQQQISTGFATVGRDTLAGFDGTNLAITSGFDSTNLALATGFDATNLALANGFNGLQQTFSNCCCDTRQAIADQGYQTQIGLNGIDKTLMQSAFQMQAGFNNLANAQAADTCTLSRGQDIIKNEIAQAAYQINNASEKNTDRIINYLTQNEMDKLRSDLQNANFQISQQAQTSDIISSLMPVAKPAYLTCSPYASAFGFNNGCGCGCAN